MNPQLQRQLNALLRDYAPHGDVQGTATLARDLERAGHREAAASAWDRAFGLAPEREDIAERRARLLDELSIELEGLCFRYIPAGIFLMGSEDGDPDEAPVHPVRLDGFWLQDTPLSWDDFQRVLGWEDGYPPEEERPEGRMGLFHLAEDNKLRLQYCENRTRFARDWHAHVPGDNRMTELFGTPERNEDIAPGYDLKPMVSIGWQDILEVAQVLNQNMTSYVAGLPSEAQWERGARGGRIGMPYPWGDAPVTPDRADADHFGTFAIQASRSLPPNDYGLYSMAGGVWEWCSDWYDAEAYARRAGSTAVHHPTGPEQGLMKVLRGGSWADCPEALRVSFRMARGSLSWRADSWGGHTTPNIGARLALRRA